MILLRRSFPVLSLAASLVFAGPAVSATVRPHHHTSTNAMVRRTASTHPIHAGRIADRPSYGMGSERATEIQTALIQHGYLTGEPTGTWDSTSVAAMQKLQSDNGWQTKLVPDSRAIIKLGLGPNTTPAPTPSPSAVAQTTQPPARD